MDISLLIIELSLSKNLIFNKLIHNIDTKNLKTTYHYYSHAAFILLYKSCGYFLLEHAIKIVIKKLD